MPYTLEPQDLTRLQQIAMQRTLAVVANAGWMRWLQVGAWLLIALAFFCLFKAYECCGDARPFVAAALGALLAMGLWVVTANHFQQRAFAGAAVAPGGWFTSGHEVQVSESGVRHGTRLGETTMPWSALLWRAEDERNHYLFIDNAIGFVFPKAALSADEQALIRQRVLDKA
jgi:hypothetical protein